MYHFIFAGQTPAMSSDSSIFLLHVCLHLLVLRPFLLFTGRGTALILPTT